ncbi:hypothetical protein HY468_02020, partial [Candidatus Roizmanbacteria bacterium]|nr:hypothetical protein [Candidatus Roizmanbacteria bacterium]
MDNTSEKRPSSPSLKTLSRRSLLKASALLTAGSAFASLPLPNVTHTSPEATSEQVQSPEVASSAWKEIASPPDEESRQYYNPLFPLTDKPVPARQMIASTSFPDRPTYSDRQFPEPVSTDLSTDLEREQQRNRFIGSHFGTYTADGTFTPFSADAVELDMPNGKVIAAPILTIEGPSSLDRICWVQGPPWEGFPAALKNVDIIFNIDGRWFTYSDELFFNRFGPLSQTITQVGGNISVVSIAAQEHFSFYIRSRTPLQINDKEFSSLCGYFNAFASQYNTDQKVLSYRNQNEVKTTDAAARLENAIEELKDAEGHYHYEEIPRRLYGNAIETVTYEKPGGNEPRIDIELKEHSSIAGMQVRIKKEDMHHLDSVECYFNYPDGQTVMVPFRTLFGSLQNTAGNQFPENERPNSYESVYAGIVNRSGSEVLLYCNIPLTGISSLALTTAKEQIPFSLTVDNVPTNVLPTSLQNKKLVPFYSDVKSQGHDHIIAPPTVGEGIMAHSFINVVDWKPKQGEDAPEPYRSNPKWRMFGAETNPGIKTYSPRSEESSITSSRDSGSWTGMEDLFSSFYNPQKSNTDPADNFKKGSPFTGGFTYQRYDGEAQNDEIHFGMWYQVGLATNNQSFM